MDTITESATAPESAPHRTKMLRYRQIIKQSMSDVASGFRSVPEKDVDTVCAFDEEHDQYLLLQIGWNEEDDERIRSIVLYLRLCDGKIWIEHDMIEDGITPALLEAGVPKEDIVLAFHPPSMRKYTEFAEG